MTDKKPQPSQPAAPQLTDKQRVSEQVGVTDMTTEAAQALSGRFPFGGAVRFFGKTDFEGHQLNDMIDLVEHANPAHLTNAGDALFKARDAMKTAAHELKKNVGAVHWEGESGDAFRTWGDNLFANANQLADFAEVAAVQISAAGSGLASVSKAMPQRDHRTEPVKVADIPPTKRVAGNAEYEAAVKVEKGRQEAINQMNRLSSFYSVSEQTLAAQKPPIFGPPPNVGVPQPAYDLPSHEYPPEQPLAGEASRHSPEAVMAVHHAAGTSPDHAHTEIAGSPRETTEHSTSLASPLLSNPVGTEINSSVPLPVPVQSQAAVAPTSSVTPMPPGVTTAFPPIAGFFNPTGNGSARALSGGHGLGMAEPTGGPASATERGATNPMGRVGTSASEAIRGGSSSAVGQSPMGRGVSGGTPRVGGSATPSGDRAGSGSGRNGIVGGRPSTQGTGSAGSRLSKPTVVGSKGALGQASSSSRPSQRGVIGAAEPSTAGKARAGGRVKGNADGVVGVPQGRSTDKRGNHSGFTSGGSGLARESWDEQASDGEEVETTLLPGQPGEGEGNGLPGR
ncbi:hypothetical protein [Streptomyces sp. NPDC056682]|uniref:hypothetical protein n=1 Tax=Streptomyces sp. NPDC056682 TaxID=3345909 RepID=UPI0036B09592